MAEVFHGDGNANQLNARADKSQVYGLKGNDTLTSGDKRDVLLVGGSGDDSLIMSGGNGTLSGGDGSDTFELTYSADKPLSAVIEDLEPARDKIVVNFDGNTAPQLSTTTSGNDVVLSDGTRLNVTLKGIRDNDYFDGTADDNVWKVLELTNAEREAKGLSPLTMADGLTAGASIRAQEITALGMSGVLTNHTRPNGSQWYTVLDGKYNFPGENLDGGALSPEQVMREWTGSASHYANIVNPDFKKLGVGYNEYDADPSDNRFYWTQMFADSFNNPETVDVSTATPEVNTVSKAVTLTEDPDTYSNSEYSVTIAALGGGDRITNTGAFVSISGGADNDTLQTGGEYATINAGKGNDSINLNSANNLIEYAAGDGSDTVSGFNLTDTLSITGGQYTPVTVGNDVVVTVGSDSILLTGAAKSNVKIIGERSLLYILTEGDDTYANYAYDATISALGGNDSITNDADYVSISGGAGYDEIINYGSNATIDGGANEDLIELSEDSRENVIEYTDGDGYDQVSGFKEDDTLRIFSIDGYYIADTIENDVVITTSRGSVTLLDAETLSDIIIESIEREPDNVITLTENPDNYTNTLEGASIQALGGNDTIANSLSNVSIHGGADNDSIQNSGTRVTINGGAGADSIRNSGARVTIDGGAGNDRINLNGSESNVISYTTGGGSDTVSGFKETDTLRISDGDGNYSTQKSGNDIIVTTDDGSVTLLNAAGLSLIRVNGMLSEEERTITLTEDDDIYYNVIKSATIAALGGNDSIHNDADKVSISGGADNDTIDNIGDLVTINAGTGDDSICLDDNAWGTEIRYSAGDGNDIVIGFSTGDDLRISGGEYTRSTVGNDVVIGVGDGSVILSGAARLLGIVILGTRSNDTSGAASKSITLTEGDDTLNNFTQGATIAALGGNDSIRNFHARVSISGGAGNDNLWNWESNVTIDAGTGNDTLRNISGNNVLIDGGDSNDYLYNSGNSVSIDAGNGNDSIQNSGDKVSINAGDGNDSITNSGDNVSISGGAGEDSITNWFGNNVTIAAGAGNDRINLYEHLTGNVIRYSLGDGDDTIWGFRKNSTIATDNIDWTSESRPSLEDEDIVWGFSENSTLNIVADRSLISSVVSGDDVIIKVGTGAVTLKKARNRTTHIIIGESGLSGGGSDSGNDNGNDSSSGNGGNSSGGSGGSGGNSGGGQSGGNTSGGTSGSEGRGSAASGGRSASGSSGRSVSTGSSGGNSFRRNSHSTTDNAATVTTSTATTNPLAATSTASTTTQQTSMATQRVYAGGDQVIADYTSGERIIFGATYTGAFFDGNGNFFAGSTTGALVVQNATDKVVDLTDAAGNSFVKAYAATTAGIIDGRGLGGFEVINGSAGSDAIYAGDGGSQLWGGADVVSDAMMGGNGTDIFIGGRTQGADFFLNASAADIVHLNDATLSDIVATAEENGTIGIAFNTGNVVAVQSSEALSATVMLADGSAYRFNHENKSWIRN